MTNSNACLQSTSNHDLLSATRDLARRATAVEADLLLHLGELDHRKLYRDYSCPSMFSFCLRELGFSEDAAYRRIVVARAARRFPALIDSLRSGRVHLAGLRLLVPHLTSDNVNDLLGQSARKSKRAIEHLLARLFPKPPVPATFRKVPDRVSTDVVPPAPCLPPEQTLGSPPPSAIPIHATSISTAQGTLASAVPALPPERPHAVIAPLSEDTYKVQFTASRSMHDKFRRAQALLRHRIPDGDPSAVLEKALDVLIERVEKERFALVQNPRPPNPEDPTQPATRSIPAWIRRAVFKRDEGRCTFVDARGHQCPETGFLEYDHVRGFARHPVHRVEDIRLRCRAHNHHAADQMYGRDFMDRARNSHESPSTCPGASSAIEYTSNPTECIPPDRDRSEPQTSS
ncbi:MAG: HNH endonuclease [Myxococcales bacterium]